MLAPQVGESVVKGPKVNTSQLRFITSRFAAKDIFVIFVLHDGHE